MSQQSWCGHMCTDDHGLVVVDSMPWGLALGLVVSVT